MKILWMFSAVSLTVAHAQPSQPTLDKFCPHFPTDAPIVWSATNPLPKSFWIYRRLPIRPFPATVISNAVLLGGLLDRGIPVPGTNDFFIWEKMPENYPGPIRALLEIIPRKGTIGYCQPHPEAIVSNLPGDDLLTAQAKNYAVQLGVDLNQVSEEKPVSHFNSDDNGYWLTNQISGRSVFLARLLDGVQFLDTGDEGDIDGFWIEFGSAGTLRSFSYVWPALERYEQHAAASKDQIISCIRAFKTMSPPLNDGNQYFERIKSFSKAKKLTITEVTPYYGEGIYGEIPTNDIPAPFIYPIAVLKAVADFGESNVPVQLYSPIVASEVSRFLAGDEPRYQNRTLTQWLQDFESPETAALAAEAIRHIGTPAVPWLLAQLDAAKAEQFNNELDQWRTKQQRLADDVEIPPPANPRKEALEALDVLGTAAEAALPTLEKMLQENPPDSRVPYVAARIGPASIPLLTRCLTNEAVGNAKLFRLEAKLCLEMLATRSELLYPKKPVGPDAPSFDRRICEFNLKVLAGACEQYKAQHPDLPGGDITVPPQPMSPK